MRLSKAYNSPFLVEESKLTRLLSVVKRIFNEENCFYKESFEATLTDAKAVRTESLDHILGLDNSHRSRIVRLLLTCECGSESGDSPAHTIEVDFDGESRGRVTITVTSDNDRIASEVMSVAEEQVERMLERGILYRFFAGGDSAFIMPLAALMSLMAVWIFIIVATLAASGEFTKIYKTMWLTPSDIAEIRPIIQDDVSLTPDQATEILSRQLRNVIAQEHKSPWSAVLDWRVVVILLPAIIVIVSLVPLAPCYPNAVFLWGDAKDSYEQLIGRRKWIWNFVVGTLIIGIIANLAVYGFGSLIGGGAA